MLVPVRIAFVMLLAFAPWTAVSSTAGPRVSFFDEQAPPPLSECGGSSNQGPSFDDPSVDTDPDRPITENASMSGGDDGDDSSDDNADGMCRSETLELWFPPEHPPFVEARLATTAKDS